MKKSIHDIAAWLDKASRGQNLFHDEMRRICDGFESARPELDELVDNHIIAKMLDECIELINKNSEDQSIFTVGYRIARIVVAKQYLSGITAQREVEFIDWIRGKYIGSEEFHESTRIRNLELHVINAILTEKVQIAEKAIQSAQSIRDSVQYLADSEKTKIEGLIKKNEVVIKEWDEKLAGHQEFCSNLVTKYSFAGIGGGLADIKRKIMQQIRMRVFILSALGILVVLLPYLSFISFYYNGLELAIYAHTVMSSIALASTEIMLIYIFRVIYKEYKQEKNELMQISYRHMLCAFLEAFGKFKKAHSDVDLSKFEALMFSALPIDGTQMPLPTDGLSSLLKVAEK